MVGVNTWYEYVQTVMKDASQTWIALAAGTNQSEVSRWARGMKQPEAQHVVKWARSQRVNVLEALIKAGYITPEEADSEPGAAPGLSSFTTPTLAVEVARRLGGDVSDLERSPTRRPLDRQPEDPDKQRSGRTRSARRTG